MEKTNNKLIETLEDIINSDYPKLAVSSMFSEEDRKELRSILLDEHSKLVTEKDVDSYLSEIVGLGIFEELIKDETITDMGWNATHLWIETASSKRRYEGKVDDAYIRKMIQRFANFAGRDFSEKEPILNTQLGNIRINAMHKIISPEGVTMSMRAARDRLVLNKENFTSMANRRVYSLLEDLFKVGLNVVVTGEVGTGKTELQKLLIGFIPDQEKIVMIEDTLETHLKRIYPEKDIISWLISDGLTHTQLIKESLRNNPDYVVLSEARDHSVYEIHQSVLTGHKIILTAHAVDAHAYPSRMIGMTKQKFDVDQDTLHEEILEYYNLGIHLEKRNIKGKYVRYISEIVEYTPDGLITIYSQNLVESDNGYVMEESFSDISKELKQKLINYNVLNRWSQKIEELSI